jgi:penicillin-binding protein 1C
MQVASILDRDLRAKGGRRSLRQKWGQMKAAYALETDWSKEQILEAYVNLVSFRGELQGVASASRGIFQKDPSGLNDAESYLLASLITAPNGPVKGTVRRACHFSTAAGSHASCDEIGALADERLSRGYRINPVTTSAPHVARLLLKDKGDTVSTIDGKLQRFVYETLNHHIRLLKERNVYDGAALVVDNETGDVLAYVGNSGTSPATAFVDGITAPRQAGSTLKPFLYELAIEKRLLTAASIVDDAPLAVQTSTGLYVPHNYDKTFRGPMSVRSALSASINLPAVRTLLLVGVVPFAERLQQLGFSYLAQEPEFHGYSLALGSAEVTLYELVNAYRTLANGGQWSEMHLSPDKKQHLKRAVMDGKATFITGDILSDRGARSATFGLENSLSTRFWSAVKTGTSKDMRDNWCIGYSERYTTGVWVGNFSGSPMRDVSGVAGAAPVWLEIMNYLHRGRTSRQPRAPAGIVKVAVDFRGSMEHHREEWFISGTEMAAPVTPDTRYARPSIRYPVEGMVISIDPDIPEESNAVPFEFGPPLAGCRWLINEVETGVHSPRYLWKTERGTFVVSIVDEKNREVDRVKFTVR